jgi:hypothetical protein
LSDQESQILPNEIKAFILKGHHFTETVFLYDKNLLGINDMFFIRNKTDDLNTLLDYFLFGGKMIAPNNDIVVPSYHLIFTESLKDLKDSVDQILQHKFNRIVCGHSGGYIDQNAKKKFREAFFWVYCYNSLSFGITKFRYIFSKIYFNSFFSK